MIPDLYLLDDGRTDERALRDTWRWVRDHGRPAAIGLSVPRLHAAPVGRWEGPGAAVCVVGTPDDALDHGADGLHLPSAAGSAVRAARRILGPERLLIAPGPPDGEPCDDGGAVDAWLTEAEAAPTSPRVRAWSLVWVRAEGPAAAAAGPALAVRVARVTGEEVRHILEGCERVRHG